MKMMIRLVCIVQVALIAWDGFVAWQAQAAPAASAAFVNETEKEFLSCGDFDGDGRADAVIVDRETGRVRVGYQTSPGTFTWANYKESGVKDVSAVAVGRLLESGKDALALVAADANTVALLAPGEPAAMNPPVPVSAPGLGPNTVVAIQIGGADDTPWPDLAISSMYNSPTPNKWTLFRNQTGQLRRLTDVDLPGTLAHARTVRLGLQPDAAELVCSLISGQDKDTFRVDTFAGGTPRTIGSVPDLESGLDYVIGNFSGGPHLQVLFFQPGSSALLVRPVSDASLAKVTFGPAATFDLGQPVKTLAVVPQGERDGLVIIFGTGDSGGVFSFDASRPPAKVQSLTPADGEVLSGATALDNAFLVVSAPAAGKIKYSTHYAIYRRTGNTNALLAQGALPSLADTDESTVPLIRQRILATLKEQSEADMKPYTNTIPGTTVRYVMVPIPGGEFVMGTPETEPGRKPDEGPQHRVKIEPFWMGAFEVTWNEYELFMYPEEERKLRETLKSDPEGDKLADAVTRPSKPYVEMSFGMGKDGYPAIAMTHHAAAKYCQWLSAKTGHFYRLPTEAEWEYACRAGTTTAYSFGDDPAKLPEYAWFDKNSDFKYQKVGRKKPNPWGLYDMHGNVLEWCLDQYSPTFYAECHQKGVVLEPWLQATQPYPHVVRGGSWDDPPEALRSGARRGSDRSWKAQDPQLPKSIWWLTDAQWVGFRIVRPLKVPPLEVMRKCWITGTEKD
jgi:formylglycine-generating enzyme required for sulfatase activity